MGGRFAIIAAALDKKIKAVIVISTAGYNIPPKNKVESEFFNYINPNAYISRIYPRPLLMLHALDDNVIPIEQAKYTYSLALEPKTFLVVNVSSCIHGYCPEMKNTIQEFLQRV